METLEGSAPGLAIHYTVYKPGVERPKYADYTITHERTGMAVASFIPNLDTARKLVAALKALPLGWELSKPTIMRQFERMDFKLRFWLYSIRDMEPMN